MEHLGQIMKKDPAIGCSKIGQFLSKCYDLEPNQGQFQKKCGFGITMAKIRVGCLKNEALSKDY